MGGGLMQLVAYGAQDVYLTGNPQITFWKVTYRRHTNFAMESIEQTFNGQADFGRRVTCTISRNGDLAYRTYLQVTMPEINQAMKNTGSNGVFARWLDFPGHQLISQVEVEIGGQRIDRQYGDWMHIWNELTQSAEQSSGYEAMVGHTTQLTYITDPSFNEVDGPCESSAPRQVCAPRNALPETTLYIPLQFWYCRNPGLALPLIALQYHEVKINLDIRPIDECLWAVSDLTATSADVKVTAAYAQSLVSASLYVDYIYLDTDERRRMAQNPHEYLIEQLQYTGAESVGSSSNKVRLNFNHPVKELIWTDAYGSGDYSGNEVVTGDKWKLVLNGHDRFAEREYRYFTQAQVWQHHTGYGSVMGENQIAVYSFALKPEEHQPSGTCNFSRIDNAQLKCSTASGGDMNIYAVNYNVLRVMSGMGGLAYSN